MVYKFHEKAKTIVADMGDSDMPYATLAGALDKEYRRGRNESSLKAASGILIAGSMSLFLLFLLLAAHQERVDERESRAASAAVLSAAVERNCKP